MRYTAVRREILAGAKNAIRAIVLDTDNRYYMSPGSHASVIIPSVRHYKAVRNGIDIADEFELARERANATSNGVEHAMNTILDDKWRSNHDTKDHLTATTEAIDAMTRQDSSWGMRMDRVIVHTGSKLLALSETGDTDPVVSPEASRDDLDTMAIHARDAIEHPDMADGGWGLSIVALGELAPIEALLLFTEASSHAQRRRDDMDRAARILDTEVIHFERRLPQATRRRDGDMKEESANEETHRH